MQTVTIIDNPLEPATWERLKVRDVRDLIMKRYPEWPAGARIYSGPIGQDHDVTPSTPGDVDRLAELDDLTVVIFPEGPWILIAILVVTVIATVALMFLLPSMPPPNTQTGSGNNSLSDRSNSARPNSRIPDIFGQVRSVPDLLAVSYRVYENNLELEIGYMCLGRGAYAIDDVRDGDTLISEIDGASVAVYGPSSSPNSGGSPQLQIGSAISDPLFEVARLNDVNGQTLKAPNDNTVQSDAQIKFLDGGIVEASGGIDFTTYFHVGDTVVIGRATDTGQTTAATGIFAAATAVTPNKFTFATFNPSTYFTAGQTVVIAHAVYTNPAVPAGGGGFGGSGSGGDVSGSDTNPDYPFDRFRDFL